VHFAQPQTSNLPQADSAVSQNQSSMKELSQLDLVFCVDVTSSMGPFIEAARTHMVNILSALAAPAEADLRVGLCGYRDYTDYSMPVLEKFPLTTDLEAMNEKLHSLQAISPADNSDAAEAVFAALLNSLDLGWRPHAYRVMILVGDAPPHGCGADAEPYPDRWPERDPSGCSLEEMGRHLESGRVNLYALSLTPSVIPVHDPILERCWDYLAGCTGGTHRRAASGRDAMLLVEDISRKVFGHLQFDREIFERFFAENMELLAEFAAAPAPTVPAPLAQMNVSAEELQAVAQRLQKRQL
jgi:hypothetical protein